MYTVVLYNFNQYLINSQAWFVSICAHIFHIIKITFFSSYTCLSVQYVFYKHFEEEKKMSKYLIEIARVFMRKRFVLNTCRFCQFHTPTEYPVRKAHVILHSWLKTTFFSRLRSVPLTPTRLQKVISSARLQVPRPRPRSCATPFRRRHGVAGCERNPSVTDAVFLPFAWAGSILRRKLHRLLQRCLKRENVMPPWMELSPLITLRETLSLPRNV